jgi:hypothetical protein
VTYTVGDLTTRVQQRIRDTGYSSTEIIGYINDAQNDVFNEYRLPFTQEIQTYNLVAGVSDITNGSGLPTNYVQAVDITLTSGGTQTVLPYVDVTVIDNFYPDPEDSVLHPPGIPIYWYFYEETIRVFPAPVANLTVSLRYYKKPTELTANGDVPEVPSEFAELLIMGAAYRVLQVKDNYDQAAILQNKYDEILQKLVVKYSVPQVGSAMRMRINRVATRKQNF